MKLLNKRVTKIQVTKCKKNTGSICIKHVVASNMYVDFHICVSGYRDGERRNEFICRKMEYVTYSVKNISDK